MYLGLDIGATSAHFATTNDGKTYTEGKVEVDAFAAFLKQKRNVQAIGLEYTGGLALKWAHTAQASNIPVFYIHSNDRAAYMRIAKQRDKTDEKDSKTITRLLYLWTTPTRRDALRLPPTLFVDAKIVQQAWNLRGLLNAAEVSKKAHRASLARAITAERCASPDLAAFWQAKSVFNTNEANELTAKATDYARQTYPGELAHLLTIPGVGPVLALNLLACIMPVERFADEKKAIAYAGLDPTSKKTGTTMNTVRASNKGNPRLKGVLWVAALGQVRRDNKFGSYYQQMVNVRQKPPMIALAAVQRKMFCTAFALLRDNRPYTGEPKPKPEPQLELPFDEPAFRPKSIKLDPDPLPDYAMTQSEYARRLDTTRQTINQRVKAGKLPTVTIGERTYIDTRQAPPK